MRPGILENRVVTIWAQQQSGLVQLPHWPVTAQGVLTSKRWTLAGAAMWRARAMALLRSPATLFMPATTMTCRGPKHRAATRLPMPSMFTSWPSSEMALLLMRKVSQVRA